MTVKAIPSRVTGPPSSMPANQAGKEISGRVNSTVP